MTALSWNFLFAQQVADTLFNPQISNPLYAETKGPIILLDEAHYNFHTTTGRFKPFANFLRRDGYVVKGNPQPFTGESLRTASILIIANALHSSNQGDNWKLPTPSAFTDEEIAAVNAWVKQGGSLFLIADHMPFPGAAEKLASTFGFKFYNGFAMRKKKPGDPDLFTPGHGLQESILTSGRNANEKITSLQSFTGQAFEIPKAATPVLVLDTAYQMMMPEVAWEFDKSTTMLPAEKLVQGAFMNVGKGRVVVFGEAAMFSAQIQQGKIKMGINAPTAGQNAQFLLNVIHWLDGKLN